MRMFFSTCVSFIKLLSDVLYFYTWEFSLQSVHVFINCFIVSTHTSLFKRVCVWLHFCVSILACVSIHECASKHICIYMHENIQYMCAYEFSVTFSSLHSAPSWLWKDLTIILCNSSLKLFKKKKLIHDKNFAEFLLRQWIVERLLIKIYLALNKLLFISNNNIITT